MSTDATSRQKSVAQSDDYTVHVEPPHVGGQRYVRCEVCGAELLLELGGRDKLVHREGCTQE